MKVTPKEMQNFFKLNFYSRLLQIMEFIEASFLFVFKFNSIATISGIFIALQDGCCIRHYFVKINVLLQSSCVVRMRWQWETFTRYCKWCMEMLMSIAVQLVNGQADYLVKEGMPKFGILLAATDHTLHKVLTMCSALSTWFLADKRVTVKELPITISWNRRSKCMQNQLGLKKVRVKWVSRMLTEKKVCS